MRKTIVIDASSLPNKWTKLRFKKQHGMISISLGFAVIYIVDLTLRETIRMFSDRINFRRIKQMK